MSYDGQRATQSIQRLNGQSSARSRDAVSSVQKHGAGARPSSAARFAVNPAIVFTIFAACNSFAALNAPIQDCDEVFNYWEPTHYLTHGYGFQTWEYAPKYAIRSWTYAGLHALPVATMRFLWPSASQPVCFYALRVLLGLACAACESRLFAAIAKMMNERVAVLFLLIMASSPGIYHASIAYLPSSFAMYTAMLGSSFFMDWTNKHGTVAGILSFGTGAILGWPFAAALILPFLLEEMSLVIRQGRTVMRTLVVRWSTGVGFCLALLALQTTIDSAFYRKLVVVPLNIVFYNVFSSKGPDLYGTEPWHFYIRNLALNFHVWLFLALAALPLLLAQTIFGTAAKKVGRSFYSIMPFYLWLAIFTLQPHKEERFMYPAYPFIALNSAYSLHVILAAMGNPRGLISVLPISLRLATIMLFVATALVISALRIASTWSAFGAPLSVYQPLLRLSRPSIVCLGKEWYRFPSHYLLPPNIEARFIRSEFRGLLPGHFASVNSSVPSSATWTEPAGMNDDNIEDLGKYTDIAQCDFIVDSHLPSTAVTTHEPNFVHDNANWRTMHCLPFLDPTSTPILGRLLWLPNSSVMPARLRRVWGEYCLLERLTHT